MCKNKLTFLLAILMSMVGVRSLAYDAEIDGIYYNFSGSKATVTYQNYSAWTSYVSDYTGDIVIPNTVIYNGYTYNVTAIGYGAFHSCKTLTSVIIPNSVTSIDNVAFCDCTGLTSVNLPNSITTIGNGAFDGCSSLTSITIPNNMTKINYHVFGDCSSLTSLTIPASVTSIGEYAFYGCSGLTSINVESGNPNYDSRNNCNAIIETETNTLIQGCNNTIIPNSVTSIGSSAFGGCGSLTSITIPNSVTSIGNGAFSRCTDLTSVNVESGNPNYDSRNNCNAIIETATNTLIFGFKSTIIPNSVTSIGDGAFSNCSGLTSITIPNSVTSIGYEAFYCSGLTSVTIGNSVTTIGGRAFMGCTGLTSVTIPNSVTNIDYQAFHDCSGLTSVTIGNSVTNIGMFAFEYCSGLTSLTFHCKEIGSWFSGLTSITKVVIGDEVTSIGNYAFSGCSGLTSIEIGSSVTSIGGSAFYNCTGLTSIEIGNNVTSIGSSAFYNCTGLTSIEIGNNVTSIGHSAFYNCTGLTFITIPNSVTYIEVYAFENCSGLKKILWLPNTPPTGYYNVKGLVNYVANNSYSRLSNIMVYPLLSSMFEVDGVKYVPVNPSERTCDAIDCAYDESAENIIIGKNVSYKGIDMTIEKVNPYICIGNTFIKNLKMTYEGDISDYAFQGCSALQSVTLNDKISSIGSYAFDNCSSLKDIAIPKSITAIGNNAFSNTAITSIIIPNSVTTIGNSAFYGCTGLTSITIPNSVTSIGNGAFAECNGLSLVTLHCESIGSWFSGLTSIIQVVIGDEVTSIGDSAFKGCTKLKDANISESVKTIGQGAFFGCNSLDHFVFGSKVESIGQGAFSGCTAITELISYAVVPPTCGSLALDDINKFECKLYVPVNSMASYQAADQWKDFFFIEEGEPALKYFDVSIDMSEGGKVLVNDKEEVKVNLKKGSDVVLQFMPNEGYKLEKVLVNDEDVTSQVVDGCYTLMYLSADVTIKVVFSNTSGISTIKADDEDVKWYTLDGKQIEQPRKGLNIVRMSNGKTKKVLVK